MIKNYFLTAIRSLQKSRFSTIINISGLAIGIACCIMIFIYVKNELSYDDFHSKADRTFRFYTIDEAQGVSSNSVGITIPRLPAAVKEELPEVELSTRVLNTGRARIEIGDRYVYAENAKYVESDFFEIFDYRLLTPEAADKFNEPRKVILTESMAKKIFGDREAVGKTLTYNDDEWQVVGLLEDVKQNSHLELDLLFSLYPSQADSSLAQYLDNWQGLGIIGYAVLNTAASERKVEGKMKEMALANDVPEFWHPQLQPLDDIHLKSADILFDTYNIGKGDITYIYSLSAVALFVLLIAAFNFMNLTTAQSSTRAKEVGVRKVLGAFKSNLVAQHLGESVLVCAIAMLLALVLVITAGSFIDIGLPVTAQEFIFSNPEIYLAIIGATVAIGVIAGLYPAFILTKFDTIKILRGKFQTSKNGVLLRKSLVVVQFAASITMIIGTIFIYKQIEFIKNKNLGFDKEQIVTISMNSSGLDQNMVTLRDKLVQHEGISGASATQNMPGRTFGRTGIRPEGASQEDPAWIVSSIYFDENYLDVMGMELTEGRNFSRQSGTDAQEGILVNEALVAQLAYKDPVGRKITLGNGSELTILGVVKNFHYASMRHAIEPLIMRYNPNANSNLTVKLNGNIASNMAFINETWKEIYPDHPMEYQFFNEEFNNLYKGDEQFSALVFNFTWLAILIACMGLFGLSAFIAEQRKKEVGVRKVLGSSVAQIVMLLSKEFVLLIILATAVAWPLAYYAINSWLDDFQYKIDLLSASSLSIFIISGLTALVIGLMTVSYQSVVAAVVNPIKSLRSE
ncbi:MAG: ABC transporter permease [Candidatus Cyclobacteriaceae bacterium M2_1C_046]